MPLTSFRVSGPARTTDSWRNSDAQSISRDGPIPRTSRAILWGASRANCRCPGNIEYITANSLLPQHYVADIGERVYIVQPERGIYPDMAILEHPSARPRATAGCARKTVMPPASVRPSDRCLAAVALRHYDAARWHSHARTLLPTGLSSLIPAGSANALPDRDARSRG
jgi:hypothetical protein